MATIGNAVIGQSGGPTSVINQSLVGVILEVKKAGHIDKDLRVHDHTPGFGSAGRFVAAAVLGDDFDQASLPGLKVNIIMGRHAGFLTAASVLARRHPEAGPHLIYVPEAPLTQEKFLADVDAVYKKQGRCLISMSEGVSAPDGKAWAEQMSEHLERHDH